jgi:hypothetical protein
MIHFEREVEEQGCKIKWSWIPHSKCTTLVIPAQTFKGEGKNCIISFLTGFNPKTAGMNIIDWQWDDKIINPEIATLLATKLNYAIETEFGGI